MPLKPRKWPNESQFEAQLRTAILQAFPWLPSAEITHQTSFSFKFGHATVTVDAEAKSNAKARADVLLRFRGDALAVFELKRPGVALTTDDEEQGLSYARMLHPRPPLVVISNGTEVRFLETHSGKRWEPSNRTESNLAGLIESGTKVAVDDLKRAVQTLMGSDDDVWMQAVREITQFTLGERTGGWDDPLSPFVEDFLLPRKESGFAVQLLRQGHRFLVIEGGPLAGKSNILREMAQITRSSDDIAVLYLDADSGLDLYGRLAFILSHTLDWAVTADEARHWLVQLSRAGGPMLALAIDNIGPDRDDIRRDLESITSNLFGPGARVVLAADDFVADQVCRSRNGRGPSSLGRRAARIGVSPLDDEEFTVAQAYMANRRLTFVHGARHCAELREPWLLRAMAADAVTAPEYGNVNLVAAMSPVPGQELIGYALRRFDVNQLPFSRYRELAFSLLEDAQDKGRPYELILESLEAFVVRRSTALRHLQLSEIDAMTESGLVRETRSQSGDSIYVIRLPELIASELSKLISAELGNRAASDPEAAASWLVDLAGSMPLGDVIAAEGILGAAFRNQGMSLALITALRNRAPERSSLTPGTRLAGYIRGIGVVNFTVNDDGGMVIEHRGEIVSITDTEVELEDNSVLGDVHPYLILSILAGHPFALVGSGPTGGLRADPDLLVGVGSTPVILRRPGGDAEIGSVPTHHFPDGLSIVCHKAGIVEPITWSLVRFFGREGEEMRDQFLDHALTNAAPALVPGLTSRLGRCRVLRTLRGPRGRTLCAETA